VLSEGTLNFLGGKQVCRTCFAKGTQECKTFAHVIEKFMDMKQQEISLANYERATAVRDCISVLESFRPAPATCECEKRLQELADLLQDKADREYCDYVESAKSPACCGEGFKIANHSFTHFELTAHREMAKREGRHQGFAAAASEIRAAIEAVEKTK
jgi:hypothetical protein